MERRRLPLSEPGCMVKTNVHAKRKSPCMTSVSELFHTTAAVMNMGMLMMRENGVICTLPAVLNIRKRTLLRTRRFNCITGISGAIRTTSFAGPEEFNIHYPLLGAYELHVMVPESNTYISLTVATEFTSTDSYNILGFSWPPPY